VRARREEQQSLDASLTSGTELSTAEEMAFNGDGPHSKRQRLEESGHRVSTNKLAVDWLAVAGIAWQRA
jgi:hypothetical protein